MRQVNNSNILADNTQRDVKSFLISGAIFSTTFAGSMNYSKYKKGELTKKEAIKDTVKLGVQGGIGTGCAVSATNYIAKGEYMNALFAIGLGAVGIYATEKLYEKTCDKSNTTKGIENESTK